MSDYDRVARAIDFIAANVESQPSLDEVAARAELSPYHFHRLFARWVGLTPKRFLQVVTVDRAKRLLADGELSLLEASEMLGLSSTSRLQDHFVKLEAVTPGEFRGSGIGMTMRYGTAESPFGLAFVAWTDRGISALSFVGEYRGSGARDTLAQRWPNARLIEDGGEARTQVARIFGRPTRDDRPISVLVRGTNFQIAVWRALLAIPPGRFASYGQVARAVGRPAAVRAVGSAVGANPCAFLIPCHRVIRRNGDLGGYRWGSTRKQAINAWEAGTIDAILPGC